MTKETKSEKMVQFIKVEEGNSCDFYTVPQIKRSDSGWVIDENRKPHDVTFNSTKDAWTCTCAYWNWKALDCAGILAAKKYRGIHGKV